METKIGTSFQLRSSFSSGGSLRRMNAAKMQYSNADRFIRSSSYGDIGGFDKADEMREKLKEMTKSIQSAVPIGKPNIAKNNHAGRTKYNFEWISSCEKAMNEDISKRLEEAGVPKDVTFEFDFDFDSQNIEITGISDEKYYESVKNVLSAGGTSTARFTFISCASRVMNGYISSLYYSWISSSLDRCFGQDINDLYIDENGNLGGVNKNFQAALDNVKKVEKIGEFPNVLDEVGFPVINNIEGIVKRMVADKNITPNISHMGYDGERIYTNDGEFKFGKDFDPNLFGEEKYIMRGTMAFYMTFYGRYNSWLENEEKFN